MKRINLSEWAINHRSLLAYLIVVLTVGGLFSYFKLGRAEDPDFTFKVMVVRTLWPGATAPEVELQVTESRVSQMRAEALVLLRDAMTSALEPELVRPHARPGGAAARRRGCRTMDGCAMAVFQAVRAFEHFTGQPANAERMIRHFASM